MERLQNRLQQLQKPKPATTSASNISSSSCDDKNSANNCDDDKFKEWYFDEFPDNSKSMDNLLEGIISSIESMPETADKAALSKAVQASISEHQQWKDEQPANSASSSQQMLPCEVSHQYSMIPADSADETLMLSDDGSILRPILHDNGCTYTAIDEQSPLYSLLTDIHPSTGKYKCGGGGKVQIMGDAVLPLQGYGSNNELPVKIVKGMGRDVFGANRSTLDGMYHTIDRVDGVLNAHMTNKHTHVNYPLYETKTAGLMFFDIWISDGQAYLIEEGEWHLAKDCSKHVNGDKLSLLIHNRLLHESDKAINMLKDQGHKGLPFTSMDHKCLVDLMANQTISGPGRGSTQYREFEPYRHFCMDLVVSTVKSVRGYEYALTIVEMQFRVKIVELLKKKSDAAEAIMSVFRRIRAKRNVTPLVVKCDRGTEFLNKTLETFFAEEMGSSYYPSETQKAWQNGVAEHAEKDLQRRARAILLNANLPPTFWCYAYQHAAHVSNMLPHKHNNGFSPLYARDNKLIDFSYLRVFGCPAHVAIRPRDRESKWATRTREGIYVGEHPARKTHMIVFPDGSRTDTNDVIFNELFDKTFRPLGKYSVSNMRDENGLTKVVPDTWDDQLESPPAVDDSLPNVVYEIVQPVRIQTKKKKKTRQKS